MMNKGQPVRVTIFGTDYTLKTAENPQHIVEVAKYLDDKMRQIAAKSSLNSALNTAILAAINITDELYKERLEKETLENEITEKTAAYGKMLKDAIEVSDRQE
jgi:cell division protein ZapA